MCLVFGSLSAYAANAPERYCYGYKKGSEFTLLGRGEGNTIEDEKSLTQKASVDGAEYETSYNKALDSIAFSIRVGDIAMATVHKASDVNTNHILFVGKDKYTILCSDFALLK